MKRMHRVASAAALLACVGCADGAGPLEPAAPDLALQGGAASARRPIRASGEFAANVDFSTLTLTPRGAHCLLVVDGELVFTGTIEGTATGTTTALVLAPCSEVAAAPPGTHRDVFRSVLEFEGTVGGEATTARVVYQGGVREGGEIQGHIRLTGGVVGVLDADAVVAVGGSYDGIVVVRSGRPTSTSTSRTWTAP